MGVNRVFRRRNAVLIFQLATDGRLSGAAPSSSSQRLILLDPVPRVRLPVHQHIRTYVLQTVTLNQKTLNDSNPTVPQATLNLSAKAVIG